MANLSKLNDLIRNRQMIRLITGFIAIIFLLILLIVFVNGSTEAKATNKQLDFTGAIDEQFSEADGESALSMQQLEVTSLKAELAQLKSSIDSIKEQKDKERDELANRFSQEIAKVKTETELKLVENANQYHKSQSNHDLNFDNGLSTAMHKPSHMLNKPAKIHSVSFDYGLDKSQVGFKSAKHYVPSGTFAKAVVLGGVDADASVDGQNRNNGVLLFKIISPGTLPNGKRSDLQGCFVTASAYGDISSERAFITLDKLSCAQNNRPIIDKSVTGWAFFGGKVGIKGIPLMRDGKVVQWAGISGALSGVAQAAQYAQSVQSFGAFGGATSVVPSSKIGAFSGYGGASKAAEKLSEYYIKRAEQYHPVIQIGAGNKVNIVFKDGFYLDNEPTEKPANHYSQSRAEETVVPPEVLAEINAANNQNAMRASS
jgi:conjugal transfer pilus assembly protein TraB